MDIIFTLFIMELENQHQQQINNDINRCKDIIKNLKIVNFLCNKECYFTCDICKTRKFLSQILNNTECNEEILSEIKKKEQEIMHFENLNNKWDIIINKVDGLLNNNQNNKLSKEEIKAELISTIRIIYDTPELLRLNETKKLIHKIYENI